MKQLRYLESVELDKATKTKQSNGVELSEYTKVNDYLVQFQELTDEISLSIYGADISRMYRISSPQYELESFLMNKVNVSSDNISLYSILFNSNRYSIRTVRKHWFDIELL